MRPVGSFRSISGAIKKGMFHHVKGCLEDTSSDHIILRYDTNDLKSNDTLEEIADETPNLAVSVKTNKNQVFISALAIRNNKLNKKGTQFNELLMGKSGITQLLLIYNKNINLNKMNKCGIYLNEYRTTHHVDNFCYNMNAQCYKICMDTQDTPLAKNVNKDLVFNV